MRAVAQTAFHVLRLISCAIIFCYVSAPEAADLARKIDEPTARRLAAEAVYRSDRYLDLFNYAANMSLPFFVYDGLSEPPAEGSFGYFAVNPWTGDVWALWGCHRMSTPALRKSQAAIRRRFTHEELEQYARLRRLKPECIVED